MGDGVVKMLTDLRSIASQFDRYFVIDNRV